MERREIVRQLLLNVDEQLSKPGWLEEFGQLCENPEGLQQQIAVLPIAKLPMRAASAFFVAFKICGFRLFG